MNNIESCSLSLDLRVGLPYVHA